MGFKITGNSGTDAEVDGTGFRAQRAVTFPLDPGSLGTYRVSLLSGTMAAGLAANSEVFQFRWTDATRVCVVERVICDGLAGSATAFTAGFAKLDLLAARSWSADGSGGTAATITGNNGKLRTSHGTTLLGAARIASTGALTAGTKTLDSQGLGQVSFSIGTAASAIYVQPNTYLIGEDIGVQHPLVLAQNEGFVIRATVPATGTWQVGFTVHWTERTAY